MPLTGDDLDTKDGALPFLFSIFEYQHPATVLAYTLKMGSLVVDSVTEVFEDQTTSIVIPGEVQPSVNALVHCSIEIGVNQPVTG
jgi:hypothetical protein